MCARIAKSQSWWNRLRLLFLLAGAFYQLRGYSDDEALFAGRFSALAILFHPIALHLPLEYVVQALSRRVVRTHSSAAGVLARADSVPAILMVLRHRYLLGCLRVHSRRPLGGCMLLATDTRSYDDST